MGYSIGGASQKAGISASTIRYYEKEGLLPSIKGIKMVFVLLLMKICRV